MDSVEVYKRMRKILSFLPENAALDMSIKVRREIYENIINRAVEKMTDREFISFLRSLEQKIRRE